jgi:flagellar hook assembly protein FlgD
MRAASAPETIVFVSPPVNIQVSFADGPGRYRLEVQGPNGVPLKMLYDKKVTFDREAWITWDGTNEEGKLMPLGTYHAVFSKDGKVLKKIALQWIKENDD